MIIKLLVEGGNMKPGPTISQKLGPLGINIGKVIQEVNKATESFKDLKVPVDLDVDTKSKTFQVRVFSPPVSELIKKELKIELGSGNPKKLKVGNLSIEQVISIAKTKIGNMLSKNLKNAVKSVVGSCVSLGVLIENKEAKEIEKEINVGKYDNEISQEKTQTDPEKLQQLKDYFNKIKQQQEEMIKKEEAAKAAAEAAAAAKAAEAGKVTEEKASEKKSEAEVKEAAKTQSESKAPQKLETKKK
ncbi:MAG: 50S ribosomal protein L11 [Candidatus Pacearchaeota archaeon]